MNTLGQLGLEFLQRFEMLPVLTQWAVTLLIVSGFIVHFFAYNERTAHDAPSIFTTGGIFFTFLGIAEGLISFDAHNIEASVPTLLSGLQTAFVASVVGVFIALTIKLRLALFGVRSRAGPPNVQGATVDDLCNQMIAVEQAIVGEEDSTLLSQVKLLRQDTNDRLDVLRRSHEEFAAKMADNNSKALITALEAVIRDFNAKISEQFGENFKRLNDAVGQLLTWQQHYRTQLSEMVKQQGETAQSMKLAADQYNTVVTKSERFSVVASHLENLLGVLNEQRQQIETSLKSLAKLLEAASGNLPKVETKIMELTEQMTFGVKMSQEELTKVLREGATSFKDTLGDIRRSLLEATQTTNQEVNAHIKQLSERTSEQIAKLDVALETELTKALNTLGSQLASLSRRFVEDYGPLTEQLREIVRLSQRVN